MSRESTEELRQRLLRDERVRELISRRAYEIYVMRGGKPGGESHDWFQAESEILSILIEEESRRADESTETDSGAAPGRVDEAGGASLVGEAIGTPETADRLEQQPGLTAEERAESQSAITAWSPAEPPSAERAPVIGDAGETQITATGAKKAASRPALKPAAARKGKPSTEKSAADNEPAAEKTTARRTATTKSAQPPTKKTRSRKKTG
ncbi:MAG TPA: DUF2934 domain-containing protein [Blastocatellia bacterium]|nr:DUF2934 domain-containing protein [Blastocatellia bacterium]